MKTKLAVAVALLTLLAALPSRAVESQDPIAGTWLMVTTPDANTGVSPFRELSHFTADGRSATTFSPLPDVARSSGWGEWRHRGDGYDSTVYALTSQDPSDGFLRARCRLHLRDAGHAFTGQCTLDVIDGHGKVITTIALRLAAARLPIVNY